MKAKELDVISLLEKTLLMQPQESLEEIGTVVKVGDGICSVYGLQKAVFGEVVAFDKGGKGLVLDLNEDFVSVVLLEGFSNVVELDIVRRTYEVFTVPVGDCLLGRVLNATGAPLDALGELQTTDRMVIDQSVAGISERQPINRSLETGIVVIDSLLPIGKGQRELLIGNRGTGKTSIAIDTILHQKGKNVICIYVSIGHKQSSTAKIIHKLDINDALDYTVIIGADAKESALNQFLAPYAGCAMGEYFMRKGKDVLIIYDDLSAHAIAYRELSLLLRRPPGREAYPGDIFFIHSKLLERAGRLSTALGGGSLTALPIIQTQGDDISAYIPTNLISITDGQIFLDAGVFKSGAKPAVSIGLSVSRVGSAAQTKAMRKVAGMLKLELAQYYELLAFAQFGSELDKSSQRALDRGRRAIEILKQEEGNTYSFVDQVIFLTLLKENYLDKLDLEQVKGFSVECARYMKGAHKDLYERILRQEEISSDDLALLKKAADEFTLIYCQA
ncbi:F0F1 ATP synthase subunit alpha [Candidatus Dependentiae bacterium]|nr:F0F1 ATP synthase subunit alpha [Candidatus Dependentiae bacterium]